MADNLALDSKNIQWFRAVYNKYTKDLVPFYNSLAVQFQGSKEAIGEVTRSKNRVEAAIKSIAYLLNPTTPTTQAELNKVTVALKKVNSDFSFWLKNAKKDEELNNKLNTILEKEGFDLNKFAEQQKVIQGRTEKVTSAKTSVWSKFKEFSPELAGSLAAAGTDLVKSLGPVGTLGMQAFKVGGGVVKGIKDRKLAAEHKALMGSVLPTGQETPEGLSRMVSGLSSLGKASVDRDTSGALKSFMGLDTSKAGSGGIGVGILASLTTFFDTKMLKTKWSKALFELLEGRKSQTTLKDRIEKGNSSVNVFGGLSKLISILLPVSLVLGAAALQIAAFLALKDKLGDTGALGVVSGPSTAVSDLASKATVDFLKGNKKKTLTGVGKGGLLGGISEFVTEKISNNTIPQYDIINEDGSRTPAETKIKNIPVTVDNTENTAKTGFDKLHSAFVTLKEELKAANKDSTTGIRSGYDAWNNRNPNLNYIDTGEADIATA